MREQEIIRRYFANLTTVGVDIGVGDDAAVVSLPSAAKLAMSTDTLNAGVHFFADADPYYLARKAAAVSLSDMAAMGAVPRWLLVSLSTPPQADSWFEAFAHGLQSSAAAYQYAVVGGDLTRAEQLSVTTSIVGIFGSAPLTRFAALAGDDVWVSGAFGGAAHALGVRTERLPAADDMRLSDFCLDDPQPRLALGAALAGIANSAMDVSDGLLVTARDIAAQSGVCLRLEMSRIPAAQSLRGLPIERQQQCFLYGGDDYELLFTVPPDNRQAVAALATSQIPLTCIGKVVAGGGVAMTLNGEAVEMPAGGYEHDFTT